MHSNFFPLGFKARACNSLLFSILLRQASVCLCVHMCSCEQERQAKGNKETESKPSSDSQGKHGNWSVRGRIAIHCGHSLHFSLHQAPSNAESKNYDSLCPYGAITRVTQRDCTGSEDTQSNFSVFLTEASFLQAWTLWRTQTSPPQGTFIRYCDGKWEMGPLQPGRLKAASWKLPPQVKEHQEHLVKSAKTKTWLSRENEPWFIFCTTLL